MKEAYMIPWEESERGWGTRPDGCSLHTSEEESRLFVKEYNDTLPDEVQDEYSRPAGKVRKVQLADEIHERLEKLGDGTTYKHGIFLSQSYMRELQREGKME